MGMFINFIQLPSREKLLAIESLFWVILIRVMIWTFPFNSVQKRVQKISRYLSTDDLQTPPAVNENRLRLMIILASRYIPQSTCLVQAMAGYILFSKYGYDTIIKIGVLSEEGQFEAHAWLEKDHRVVLGESEKDYKIILDIDRSDH